MTDSQTPTKRTVDLSIDIRSSLEAVWAALSTGEGIANWFPPIASVTPGPGGSVTFSWGAGEEWTSPIAHWDPHARLGLVSELPDASGRMVPLAVDFHLSAKGGTVTVRLVHSGFDDSESWDDFIDGVSAGWAYFLVNLRLYLERHPGATRVLVSARPQCHATIEEGRAAVFGTDALDADADVTTLGVGQTCTLRIGDARRNARVVLTNLPRAIAFQIPELNDALLFVEREGVKPKHRVGLWLSLYGLDPQRVPALRTAFDAMGARLAARLNEETV
jgi:uncharacterized protein YndB with AHSA1/START domain